MKKLELHIYERNTNYRKGRLLFNGSEIATTIEPTDGFIYQTDLITEIEFMKKRGLIAIPYGTYKILLAYSEKFGEVIPHVLNVPGFDYVEMHIGNSSKDTKGCILVGLTTKYNQDFIGSSRSAFMLLMAYLKDVPVEDIELGIYEK